MKIRLAQFRALQFRCLRWIMARDYQDLYQASLKSNVLSLASDVSQILYQQTLEREGFVHCTRCSQRFGLRRNDDGKYYCSRHLQVPAVA